MTDLIVLAGELAKEIEWQTIPEDMSVDDLTPMLVKAIKEFYIMAGKADQYDDSMDVYDGAVPIAFTATFKLDEQEYILAAAKVFFFEKVQTTVNNIVSYSTDAMSRTNADKPYKNLQDTIALLRARKIEIWHKMTRYNMVCL